MTDLTPRQAEILAYIREHIAKKGYPPTVRELGSEFTIHINAARQHLMALEKHGAIVRERGKSRALRVVETAQ